MRKALALTAILVAGSFYLSCEKDDICAEGTQTTPSLVLEFYNKDNTTTLQNVTDLQVKAVGQENPLPQNGVLFATTNKVVLPLRTNEDVTVYELTFRSQATDGTKNTDILTIDYTRNETYVSRACGYKTTFTLTPPSPITDMLTAGTDVTRWTNSISVENTSIENENETHVKIYF
ncbi:MAG: DUF6452 family protein [Flavobacterium sp.]